MAETLPTRPAGRAWQVLAAVLVAVAFALLLWLGTWQMQRLHWKESLLAAIAERRTAPPVDLAAIEAIAAEGGDIEYRTVALSGAFLNDRERHFFATFSGRTGYYVYTPLQLADGRAIFVNRGFVPFELKEPATRPQSQIPGPVTLHGLARARLAEKPSWVVPDNDLAKNIFYWKDLAAMTKTAGLDPARTVPFFVDADAAPHAGGLPMGGVTQFDLPNNHLQYALTWYGLAAALLGVTVLFVVKRRRGTL